ncbi:low molecular weight protein arginine phosphatase [Priestia endophytica]|uniref:Protein-tyrosine phosphatase n=1 Tax=Priestia endophytica DSM 13796 TaxID=1121089 RepID=A0A1I5ZTE0_9BACI|nr:low molecular weight protein arginine phosphatase [Priestia endophytica]KYG28565.1 phosphatase [Priestia endophytica]MBG9810770.1 phosphatase [Priestia endophytica]MCM3540322.1 low molecular weight protein arginine phosphatase [Priestia endophytica]RAS77502.1 low molecular weight phosphatase family protein [Priestia endophytica]SFQ59736.1 protein-tyrosine phosphatase [Priestia endophytica DSM 13796]
MKRVLFVCTGNTCRSPMASALLKERKDFEVQSAGIFAGKGMPISAAASQALLERGIEHNHRSQPFTSELAEWADYIFTMTNQHKQLIVSQHPSAAKKTFTLHEFSTSSVGDVQDPYGGDLSIYRETLGELDELIRQLILKLADK